MLDFDFSPPGLFLPRQLIKIEEGTREYKKAMKVRSPEAIAASQDFILFREYVCGQVTYPYMLDWIAELNTGQDSRFLRGIAGDDTCILAPRNSAKSTLVLQWIAWIIGTHATVGISLKILYISYVVDIASGKSRQIKAIIESDRYQEVFPCVRPSKAKWGESEWAIDFNYAGLSTIEEPYTLACSGLAGAINSKRCLTGDNLVQTRSGYRRIDELMDAIDTEVLAYNHQTDKPEWSKIAATSSRRDNWIFGIMTYAGKYIRCTHDHRFYLPGKGYYKARTLDIDDILLTPGGIDAVKSISSVTNTNELVYDIEVEGNHNFFANDVLVHNSHILLFDDLIKNPSEAKNKKIQDRMLENYNNIVRFTKHDGARSINLGTRMSKFDIYTTAFVAPRWKVIKQSALITVNGIEQSYCEERVSLDTLLQERQDNEESFLLQRQNEIPELSSIGIQSHHIKHSWIPEQLERIIIAMDTADSSDENSNATALMVLGIANDSIYVIDGFEGRIRGNLKKIDLIYDYWLRYKSMCKYPAIFAVDWHGHSKSMEGDLNAYLEDLSEDESLDQAFKNIVIEKVKSTARGEKIDRIESHSYLFEKGRVLFNKLSSTSEIDSQEVLTKVINEITDYNALAHNDCMDALEVGIFVARQFLSDGLTVAG